MAKGKAAGTRSSRKRRGKSEDVTGAKAATVEMRKAEPAQLELTASAIEKKPGQFRSYFNRALSDYGIFTKHQGRYRETIKEAKEENPLLAEAVKLAIKLVDDEGEIDFDDIKAKLQVSGFILQEFGSSLQLTLHDTLLGDEKDYAFKRGFERGTAGVALDMPYPKNSDLNEIYASGYRNGQLKLMNLPHGTTRQTAVQRLDADAPVDVLGQAPVADEQEENPGKPGEDMAAQMKTVEDAISAKAVKGRVTGATSFVQRTLGCGYNRAKAVLDGMVEGGIISEPDKDGARHLVLLPEPPKARGAEDDGFAGDPMREPEPEMEAMH